MAVSPGNRWKGASGTIILKDIWKFNQQYAGNCDAYLYLLVQCATKTMNEAVVEGMGSVWALSAEGSRHLQLGPATQEAVIAYNAPQPWHPEAKAFCKNALNVFVGRYTDGPLKGQLKPWNFHHVDERTGRLNPNQMHGQVIHRHHGDPTNAAAFSQGHSRTFDPQCE